MIHRRKSMHSTGYLNDDGMIRRHRYFEFDVNNTQIISGQFSTLSGQEISVDWGDGSARSVYSGTDQAWSHDYGSAGNYVVRIFGSFALTKMVMNTSGINISFDVATLPAGFVHLYLLVDNVVTGDIANLPASVTYFGLWGRNVVTGDIANLSDGIGTFRCIGYNTVTGDIANLPSSVVQFECAGYNTVSGDLANLPDNIVRFGAWGNNTISEYSGKTWITKPAIFKFIPVSPGGLSTAEVDQLLIDFDDDFTWASGDVIQLTGANAARSSASDAAVANMVAEGATVTTN